MFKAVRLHIAVGARQRCTRVFPLQPPLDGIESLESSLKANGVFTATKFGPQCAQATSDAGIFSSGKSTTSEDCLYLNIWTPAYNDTFDISAKSLPVFVWIYGGRFTGGSGDVLIYDGTGLASKDIIVVTLNYRLGPFGFLAHPELSGGLCQLPRRHVESFCQGPCPWRHC